MAGNISVQAEPEKVLILHTRNSIEMISLINQFNVNYWSATFNQPTVGFKGIIQMPPKPSAPGSAPPTAAG